jgi:hypothetical protein
MTTMKMRTALREALRRNGYADRQPTLPEVPQHLELPGLGDWQWWAATNVNAQHWYVNGGTAVRVNFRKGEPVSWSPAREWTLTTPIPKVA